MCKYCQRSLNYIRNATFETVLILNVNDNYEDKKIMSIDDIVLIQETYNKAIRNGCNEARTNSAIFEKNRFRYSLWQPPNSSPHPSSHP